MTQGVHCLYPGVLAIDPKMHGYLARGGGGVKMHGYLARGGGGTPPKLGYNAQHKLKIWTLRDLKTSEKRGSKRSETRL